MKETKYITPLRVVCSSLCGASISQCSFDAVRLCVEECVDVEFHFNDKRHVIRYADLIDLVNEVG